ncbi:hypothetical protein [Salinithrix halophila]|uniref:DUF4395 domain-containing protein n=1 Tax=Salinithrix halophila TaxID=1485204 RepID=A0ABV8JI62_9BACL
MSPKQKIWRMVLLTLLAIGLVQMLVNRPFMVIGILAIIGAVTYLYKYPPRWLIRLSYPRNSGHPRLGEKKNKASGTPSKQKKKYNKKQRAFRVIDGNKKTPGSDPPQNTKTQ